MAQKREPIAWITRGGKHIPIFDKDELDKERQIAKNKQQADNASDHETHKPLDTIKDKKELQDAMHKLFIDPDSYLHSDEYKQLNEKLSNALEQDKKDAARKEELRKIMEEEKVNDKQDDLDDMDDMERAMYEDMMKNPLYADMFAKYTEKGKAAKKELDALNAKGSNESYYRDKLQSLKSKESKRQKEEWLQEKSTVSEDVKDNYYGFEKDTHTSYYQDLYDKGQAKIVEMSPKEYLQYCAYKIFENSTYESQLRVAIGDAEHTMELVKLIKSGTKMYMPALDFKKGGQEGRHRAVAAMILGIDKIPVIVVGNYKK